MILSRWLLSLANVPACHAFRVFVVNYMGNRAVDSLCHSGKHCRSAGSSMGKVMCEAILTRRNTGDA